MDSKKQNKGKSASASISNIAIRFHADDEELEQVVQSNDDGGKDETIFKQDMVEDESFSLSSSQLSTPTSTQSDLTSSSSSSCVLSRLGKRSTSLESASASSGPDTSSGDAWRLFREVRGRITKTVEEKIEEIKSDRLKSNKNKQKNSKLGNKVDSSSVSDSEDQSESSSSIKVNDSSNISNNNSSTEQKDCDNQVKKNDNQIQNDSGRSTPIINSGGGSSSDKDELTNSTVSNSSQKDKSDEDSKKSKHDQPDSKNGKDKKREKHASFVIDDKKPTEEKKKEKTDEDGHTKKEKKSRRFHFRERFHGSPDKKKQEISIKFSSLKDEEESDDEKECVSVEFGLEASELVNIVEPVKETLKKLSPSSSFSLSSPCTPTYFAKLSNLLWHWRYAVIAAILAIAHYVWPFHYMLGFFVGVLLTLQVMIAVNWAHDVFNLRESPSHGLDYTEENSPYSGFVYPIFASSHYFSPQDNPEQITYEGWLNEFSQEYSPDLYHISLTDTVHVKLKGSTLTISNPSTKIPKRASWNEPEHKKLYNRQRLFDIAGCKVQLLPVGLTHKRIWSKKYPICITLLKMSKLGVRYRCKGKITIENDQPWLDPEVEVKTPVESNENQEIFPMDPIDQFSLEEKLDDKSLEGEPQVKETVINSEESPLKEKNKLVNNDSINEDDDDDEDFVRISPSLLNEFCVYLFARCDRQKEIWFRRLVAAAGYQSFTPPEKETSEIIEVENNADEKDKEKQQQQPKTAENSDERQEIVTPASIRYENEKEYLNYMNRLSQKKIPKLPSKEKESNTKQANVSKQSASSPTNSVPPQTDDMYDVCEEVMWVNAFGGRLLYDVLRDSFWLSKIQEKFQRKLSAIKLPYFMEELVISHIDFGQTVPIVQGTSRPVLNEDGVWVDLSIIYEGHFRLTIDTKLNLMKLKKAQASLDDSDTSLLDSSTSNLSVMCSSASTDTLQVTPPSSYNATIQKSAIFDSDVEDSAESSSEELDISKTGPITLPDLTPSSPGSSTSHKMLRMVDKIAASKYFQQVTDYKYIKRAMEGVSNTNIALEVEVRGLAGTLVLNFPPPPSDRLWYGFRPNPNLQLSAQPKVGDRTITLLHISTWIERRLRREFQKLLVLPNMDDLIIPVMNKERPS